MARYPQRWYVGTEMYNLLAPWFGHDPIPVLPKFPTTDSFLTNYGQTNNMTEQGLIEHAQNGSELAIAHLAIDYPGVDWRYAITHVNGRWLPGNEINLVWAEMVKLQATSGQFLHEISVGLQKALDTAYHKPVKAEDIAMISPAGRSWDFKNKGGFKFGKGSNYTPPKKKRKK